MFESDQTNQRLSEILEFVKGVGSVMISTIFAELLELRNLNRGKVAIVAYMRKFITIINL